MVVRWPRESADAEAVVRRIGGVVRVVNNIRRRPRGESARLRSTRRILTASVHAAGVERCLARRRLTWGKIRTN
jgi:hypothetical protein